MCIEDDVMKNLCEQGEHEREGAAAALADKALADCPYADDTLAGTFWRYGFEQAFHELLMLKHMDYVFNIAESPPSDFDLARTSSIPVRRAIEGGFWRPRYVTLATLDEIEKARAA